MLVRALEQLLERLVPDSDGDEILGDLREGRLDAGRRRRWAAGWHLSQLAGMILYYATLRATSRLRRNRAGGARASHGRALSFASLGQDVRFALRSLTSQRWRSLSAVGMLALAIGIATAMFTIVDALILRPVPFHEPDQLARLSMQNEDGGPGFVPPAVFQAWRESPAFAAVEVAEGDSAYVGFEGGETRKRVARVTPGVFDLLGGVRPVQGRLFESSEGQPGVDDRVLISEDLWRSLYRADPELLGQAIRVDDTPMVVVGILPSGFHFPDWNTEIWRVASFAGSDERPTVYVRFASAMPRTDALRVATTAAHEVHDYESGWRASSWPLGAHLDDYYAQAMPLLAGAVVLLFVVLCANVASLLLTGLAARAHELGTRAALGAPRGRLVRQVFVETVLLGAAGVVAGAGLSWMLVAASRSFLPDAAFVHSLNTLDVDLRALGVASIAGLVATVAVGVPPALAGTRVDASRLLQLSGGTTSTGRSRAAARALLVCQIALSCTLVFGATLLVRSFVNLLNEDRGLDVRSVLAADMVFPSESFETEQARAAAAQAVEDQIRALPGVEAVSWSYGTPPGGGVVQQSDWSPDLPGAEPVAMRVYQFIVDPSFFDLYRVPILRGRSFRSTDDRTDVLVSERFAQSLWPEQDPLGRTFTFDGSPPLNVLGLVQDIRYPSLDSTLDSPQIYTQFREFGVRAMLSLRCDVQCPDPARMRQQLRAAHLDVTFLDVGSPESWYLREYVRPRAAATLASVFAVTALIAAAAGLFSLFSQSVLRRRRELGIHTALGASPVHLRRLVWSDGMVVTLVGIGLGACASILLARVASSLLFDVSMADPMSWGVVAFTLTATAAAAGWHPTRTAVRAAPKALLGEE